MNRCWMWMVATVLGLSACADEANIVGLWVGTVAAGDAITLDVTRGAPDVEAELTIADGAVRGLTGTFTDTRLDIGTNDDLGGVNFNATVVDDSMTGTFVLAEIGTPVTTGDAFTMTRE